MDALIGRDAELGRLRRRLDEAVAGSGRLVLVAGEPGIGKTRLAEELARAAAERGIPVAWGRSVETEGAPPFWPWRQVLRDLARQAEPGRLRAVAGDDAPTLAHLSSELGRLLDAAPGPLDEGAAGRFQLFDAVAGFLRRLAAPGGLLVVIDDVHWADRSSLLLLRHLAGELSRASLLVLATRRDEDGAGGELLAALAAGRGAESLPLAGLDHEACAAQLASVAGGDVDATTASRVHAITDGNPFFTAEMARLLVNPAATSTALDVPRTVRDVVLRRVDRLDHECRELLDAAAVIGRDFDAETVAVMTDRSVVSVLDAIDPARRARIVDNGAMAGDLWFAHALVRETLYAELPASHRRLLHRRAADALRWLHAERLDAHLAAIAQHLLAAATSGEDAVEASRWLRRAAAEAMARLAWEEGVRLYGLALDAASERVGGGERAEALLGLAIGLFRSGELDGSLRRCVDASRAARAAGLPALMGQAALVLEGVSDPKWNHTLAALCDDALAELGDADPPLRARLLAQRTVWRLFAGDRAGAVEASRAALTLAEQSGDDGAVASVLRARQVVLSGPEGLEERRAIAARMLDLGLRDGNPTTLLWGRLWQIDVDQELGDLPAVRRHADALEAELSGHATPVARWHLLRVRWQLAQARGDFDEAIALAGRGREIMLRAQLAQAAGMTDAFLGGALARHRGVQPAAIETVRAHLDAVRGPFAPLVRISLVNALLWAGRVDEARAEYRLLPPMGAEEVPPVSRLPFSAFRGQAAAELGDCTAALTAYAELLPYRDRHLGAGGPEYRGSIELVLGVIARHCGDLAVAVEHLRAAVDVHRRSEAVAFVVESQCHLAEALLAAGAGVHRAEARGLAVEALEVAGRLGMPPYAAWARRLLDATEARSGSPLSRREEEVAALVARGLTSKEIAAALHLSERTAQNHVQHILDKLGFASRSQIAAWVAARAASR